MGFIPKWHQLILCADLQMVTSSRLLVNNELYPKEASVCYLVSGFTPSTARFVHNSIIFKEVCRVFVLRCQSASHFTCCVLSHRVRLSHTVYTVIQVTFINSYIHTSIHSYIKPFHIFIHSCIHNIDTTSFIHGCIGHPELCFVPYVWSSLIIMPSGKFCKWTVDNCLLFQRCHPQRRCSSDVTNQFQFQRCHPQHSCSSDVTNQVNFNGVIPSVAVQVMSLIKSISMVSSLT